MICRRSHRRSDSTRVWPQQVEAQAGRGLLQQRCHVALRVSSGSCPVAAVELDQFGSLSLVVFLTSVGRTADSRTCSYLQTASASGPATQSSELSYLYFERVAAAAPATALARSSCPFGA